MRTKAVIALLLAALGGASAAQAQPMMMPGGGGMPNLAGVVGRPLPDRGMPAGTVSVRVARQIPANAVVDAEIAAVIRNAGGDLRRRTAKTDGGGRALFEGMAPGDEFKATVKVDGEELATETFTIPPEGGIKTMLISGLKAAGGGGAGPAAGAEGAGAAPEAGGEQRGFTLGASSGNALPEPSLPKGSLEVRPVDESGAPIPNHPVALGMVGKDNAINVRKAKTDAAGVARFTDLPTGDGTGYAAVIEWHGMRLGTTPFAMPPEGGARAEIRALTRTSDPNVIRIGEGSRIVVELHEDSLVILEILPLENVSNKLFDPGPGAVEIPLPQGFVGGQAPAESEHPIEVRQNHGVAVHGPIPPKATILANSARDAGQEVRFEFVLPFHSDTREVVQPMPNGIGRLEIITESTSPVTVSGPGVGERQAVKFGDRNYWVSQVDAVPPGGKLTFTLAGLPATDPTGRYVSLGLALALVAAAIYFGRSPEKDRPRSGGRAGGAGFSKPEERARLIDRREALFAALVVLETEARAAKSVAPPERRKELVGELEQVYRKLAAQDDEQRAA
jgi:hypothetical protein